MRAAMIEPGPPTSDTTPLWSPITPMMILLPENSALAEEDQIQVANSGTSQSRRMRKAPFQSPGTLAGGHDTFVTDMVHMFQVRLATAAIRAMEGLCPSRLMIPTMPSTPPWPRESAG